MKFEPAVLEQESQGQPAAEGGKGVRNTIILIVWCVLSALFGLHSVFTFSQSLSAQPWICLLAAGEGQTGI